MKRSLERRSTLLGRVVAEPKLKKCTPATVPHKANVHHAASAAVLRGGPHLAAKLD